MNISESKNLLNTQLVIVDNKLYQKKNESKRLTPLDARWKADWKSIDDGKYSLQLDNTLYQIPKEMVVDVQSAIGIHIPQTAISLFYKGKQLISYSGQSTVVLMKNILEDKMFVVKTIKKNKHLASREIQILKKLNHKNIIRLLQMFEDENKTYLVFEKFDKTICQKFDHLECQIILYKVLKALKYLHARDIVHRDLKPQNIMLTEENKVKIIDFGLSIQLLPKPGAINFSGTPGYIAPEAFDGIYDCKYDIFSLGAIMFEMYYSENLIKGDFITDIISNNKNFKGINVTNRSQLIRDDGLDLMKKMLRITPEERISAKQALKHPFFNCFKGTCIEIKNIIPKLFDSITNCNIGRSTLPSSLRSYNDNLLFNSQKF